MPAQPAPSEIVNLLLVLLLVPLTALTIARYRNPGYRFTTTGCFCITAAIVLAVVEHPLQLQVISDLKNVLYACGGVAFAVGIWQLNLATRRGGV